MGRGTFLACSELAPHDSKLGVPSPESHQRTLEHDTDGRYVPGTVPIEWRYPAAGPFVAVYASPLLVAAVVMR